VAQTADPAKLVSSVFGGVVAVLVMLLVLHGPIATNILNVYSSALAGRSGGIKLPRRVLGLIAGVVGYAVTLSFGHAPDLAARFAVAGGVYLIGMRGKVAAAPARELAGAAGQPTA